MNISSKLPEVGSLKLMMVGMFTLWRPGDAPKTGEFLGDQLGQGRQHPATLTQRERKLIPQKEQAWV